MSERLLKIRYAEAGERLDKVVAAHLSDLSRSQVQRLIADGLVSVAGRPILKAAERVEGPADIEVRLPSPGPPSHQPEDIPLDILYESDDLLVINKPAGMVVHPAPGHPDGTLVNAVLGHDPDLEGVGDEQRPGLVHRLDKDTSGVMVVAKNDRAHREMQRQFKAREVRKLYLALLDGLPPTDTGRIETDIARDPRDRKRMAVVAAGRGKPAVTEYRVREKFPAHALAEVNLLTGRTHQIRLHCAYLKCPIVGDTVYGRRRPTLPVARQCLHAAELRLTPPGQRTPIDLVAPLPDDFEAALQLLRRDRM